MSDFVTFADVEAIRSYGLTLLCRVDGKTVWVNNGRSRVPLSARRGARFTCVSRRLVRHQLGTDLAAGADDEGQLRTGHRMRPSLSIRADGAGRPLGSRFDRVGPAGRQPRSCSATEGAMR